MTHIPAIARCDVSDMSIKDALGVAYLSSMIVWLPPFFHLHLLQYCLAVCIWSLQAEKPIERGSTLIIKAKSIRLSPGVRFSKPKKYFGGQTSLTEK